MKGDLQRRCSFSNFAEPFQLLQKSHFHWHENLVNFFFFFVVFLFSHQVGKYNFSFSSIFFQLLTLDNLVRVNARACAHWRPPRACPAGMCVAGVCLRCVLKARSILGPGNLPQMKLDSVPGERREQTFQSCRKSISTWWGSPAPPPILLSLPPLPPLCPLSLSSPLHRLLLCLSIPRSTFSTLAAPPQLIKPHRTTEPPLCH